MFELLLSSVSSFLWAVILFAGAVIAVSIAILVVMLLFAVLSRSRTSKEKY